MVGVAGKEWVGGEIDLNLKTMQTNRSYCMDGSKVKSV